MVCLDLPKESATSLICLSLPRDKMALVPKCKTLSAFVFAFSDVAEWEDSFLRVIMEADSHFIALAIVCRSFLFHKANTSNDNLYRSNVN